jgi:tetratricopeptide (TPR) repeat protein
VVVVGGKPGKAYEVLGFEAWAPFNPLYEAGDYAEAADQARGAIEANPEAAGAFFCLACCEALAGRADDAARHLRHALEESERLRGLARRNSDLDSIRDRPEIAEVLAARRDLSGPLFQLLVKPFLLLQRHTTDSRPTGNVSPRLIPRSAADDEAWPKTDR